MSAARSARRRAAKQDHRPIIGQGELISRAYDPADLEGAVFYGLTLPRARQDAILSQADNAVQMLDAAHGLSGDVRKLSMTRLTAAALVSDWTGNSSAFNSVLAEINTELRYHPASRMLEAV